MTEAASQRRSDRLDRTSLYINPDEVAQDRFGDWNNPTAVLRAAEWAAARRETLLDQQAGIAFETVFSGPDKLAFLQRARLEGYFIRLFFIGTSDPRINASRIASRVMEGGHTVPIEKVVSRYVRSIANLDEGIRLAHRAYIFDNSVEQADARLCARTEDGLLRKVYGPLPSWTRGALNPLRLHSAFVDLRLTG